MNTNNDDKLQGYSLLSKIGKKVLRPGGKDLTIKMIHSLQISSLDDIAEFAPGLGFTASVALKSNPKSYTGIELSIDSALLLEKKLSRANTKIIVGNAAQTSLSENSIDKVYGEAMLTMHADHRKSEIIKEAYRILKKGGLYGIHELGLTPNLIEEKTKTQIQKELSQISKVNARPLTESEWKKLLEKEGFKIKYVLTNSMNLLNVKRVVDDEGITQTLKIIFNVITHPKARKRVFEMKKVFTKYKQHINAIAIVAEKI
jgi:ubiquinone/menaquinone biosynthesis C-methylase UbiE